MVIISPSYHYGLFQFLAYQGDSVFQFFSLGPPFTSTSYNTLYPCTLAQYATIVQGSPQFYYFIFYSTISFLVPLILGNVMRLSLLTFHTFFYLPIPSYITLPQFFPLIFNPATMLFIFLFCVHHAPHTSKIFLAI
jgi:hypothetical protein